MRHVQEFAIRVGANTSQSGKYVNVQGFAAFKITRIDSNTIYGRAASLAVDDPDDYRPATAKSVRLIPGEISPY